MKTMPKGINSSEKDFVETIYFWMIMYNQLFKDVHNNAICYLHVSVA
jgi:hypothetical protein